jgi:iron complex transport system ATP-binding protein
MLLDRGYKVTAGVLNVLDTDYEVAGELGIPVVGELPFSSISQESHNANLELIDKADFVIATGFPVGWGNLKNLEAIGRAIYQNIPAIMVETAPLQERDFTDGAGTRVYESLKKRGLTIVNDLSEGLKKIEEVKKK